MIVKVKRKEKETALPVYARKGDAGMDVYAAEDVLIAPGATVCVPTGLFVAIPDGYEIQVRPRSGLSLKTKLRVANTPGTIDSGYRGEIGIIIDNISRDYVWNYLDRDYPVPMSTDVSCHILDINAEHIRPTGSSDRHSNHGYYQIKKGDKIAQIVLMKHEEIEWLPVEELSETERGTGGFGSTGV